MISNSFIAAGLGSEFTLPAGKSAVYALSGTFSASLQLEVSRNGGMSYSAHTTVLTAPVAAMFVNESTGDLRLRWRCIARASGTAVCVLTNLEGGETYDSPMGAVNPITFGADPHGLLSSSRAIEQADAAAAAAGVSVYYTPGTYLVTRAIIPTCPHIGQCRETVTIKHAPGAGVHWLMTDSGDAPSNVYIRGLGFDGNRLELTADPDDEDNVQGAISFVSVDDNALNISVLDVKIWNFFARGVGLQISGYDQVNLDKLNIQDGGDGLYHLIYLRRVANYNIDNLFLRTSKQNSCLKIGPRHEEHDESRGTVSNVICIGGNRGFVIAAAKCITISNFICDGQSLHGIDIGIEEELTNDDVAISTGIFVNIGETALECVSVRNLVAGDLTFTECQQEGISLRNINHFGISNAVFDATNVQALLDYDGQTAGFTIGETVTDGTATGVVVADTDAGATGTLRLRNIDGAFTNNLPLTGDLGGAAVVNGVLAYQTLRHVKIEDGPSINRGTLASCFFSCDSVNGTRYAVDNQEAAAAVVVDSSCQARGTYTTIYNGIYQTATADMLNLTPMSVEPPAVNGTIYYDSDTHKFRGCANGAFADLH